MSALRKSIVIPYERYQMLSKSAEERSVDHNKLKTDENTTLEPTSVDAQSNATNENHTTESTDTTTQKVKSDDNTVDIPPHTDSLADDTKSEEDQIEKIEDTGSLIRVPPPGEPAKKSKKRVLKDLTNKSKRRKTWKDLWFAI